jgi:hypothetical protein
MLDMIQRYLAVRFCKCQCDVAFELARRTPRFVLERFCMLLPTPLSSSSKTLRCPLRRIPVNV